MAFPLGLDVPMSAVGVSVPVSRSLLRIEMTSSQESSPTAQIFLVLNGVQKADRKVLNKPNKYELDSTIEYSSAGLSFEPIGTSGIRKERSERPPPPALPPRHSLSCSRFILTKTNSITASSQNLLHIYSFSLSHTGDTGRHARPGKAGKPGN